MDAKSIIKQAAMQSLSMNPSDDDFLLYLDFLNQAHFELFNFTFMVNPRAEKHHEREVALTDGATDVVGTFKVTHVYLSTSNTILQPITPGYILTKDPGVKTTGTPRYWYFQNQKICIYPKPTQDEATIGYWGIKRPASLTIDSTSNDIPYEESYQPLLVDGTSYLIYQNDSGMKNSAELKSTLQRWQYGMRQFHSYLNSLSNTNITSVSSTDNLITAFYQDGIRLSYD